jgi:hypothetical protein
MARCAVGVSIDHGRGSSCSVTPGTAKSGSPLSYPNVAIVVYRCRNNVFGMLQSFTFMMQSVLVYVANGCAYKLYPCSRHVASVPCECFEI